MENKKKGNRINKLESQELMDALPEKLQRLISGIPENRRRLANKFLDIDQYFSLIYNLRDKSLEIKSHNLKYSTISKDYDRKYIQRAACLYLKDPQYVHDFIKLHRPILEIYFNEAIGEKTKSEAKKSELDSAYNDIFKDPLFEIQIMGRLISHDENEPTSENIDRKFLYSYNKATGISNYVKQYLQYVKKITSNYEVITDGININFYHKNNEETLPGQVLLGNIDDTALSLISKKPTKSEDDYLFFPKVLPTYNNNQINVVSDIHTLDKIPFTNKNFNILAGDIVNSDLVTNPSIKGFIVMGNWDISAYMKIFYPEFFDKKSKDFNFILSILFKYLEYKKIDQKAKAEIEQATPFIMNMVAGKPLVSLSDEQINRKSNYILQNLDEIMNDDIYQRTKDALQKRFPKMRVLNNESLEYQGIRYVGLTLPMNPKSELARTQYQDFIYHNLKKILKDDVSTPTVIVSHAPLFNELSLVTPSSDAYNKNNVCINSKIKDLFHQFNIIGVIHGHHHLKATTGRAKNVNFANKRMFVICSIYSDLNTGYDLKKVLAHL